VSDPQAIIQVLKELLDNAIKFTPHGGRIDLTVTGETVAGETVIAPSAAAAVRIVVTDTGIGMSDEQLSALFRPFAQGDQTLTRRSNGLPSSAWRSAHSLHMRTLVPCLARW
jgi:signal transduction histidine kinase